MTNVEKEPINSESFANIEIRHHYPIIDGVKLHYTESGGKSSRVIILGGLPFYAWEGFIGFIKPISANHIVNVFEYPGFGESQAFSDREHNFENAAETLHKTIQQENLDRIHIIGLSFGGGVALYLTAKYPEDFRSLIPSGAPIEFPAKTRERRNLLKNPVVNHLIEKFFAKLDLPWI